MRSRVFVAKLLIQLITCLSLAAAVAAQNETDVEDVLLHALGRLDPERRAISAVSVSTEQSQVVFGTMDGSVYINDAKLLPNAFDKLTIAKSRHAASVLDIAHPQDGSWFVSGGIDGSVRIGSCNGEELWRILPKMGWINAVAASEDGTLFAAGGDTGSVQIWDRMNWQSVLVSVASKSAVTALAFGPSTERFATGHYDGTVVVHRKSGALPISGQSGYVTRLVYSPSGERLAIGTSSGAILIYDLKADVPLQTFVGHQGPVNGLQYTADGQQIFSAGADGQVLIIDTITGMQRNAGIPKDESLQGLGLLSENLVVAVRQTGNIRAWNRNDITPDVTILSSHRVAQVGLSPDKQFVTTALVEGRSKTTDSDQRRAPETEFLNSRTGQTEFRLPHTSSLVWSNQGKFALTSDGQSLIQISRRFLEDLPGNTQNFRSELKISIDASSSIAALSDSGTRAVVSSGNDQLRVIRVPGLETLAELPLEGRFLETAAFSPDESTLAVVLENNDIMMWKLPSGTVDQIAVDPNGTNPASEETGRRVKKISSLKLVSNLRRRYPISVCEQRHCRYCFLS